MVQLHTPFYTYQSLSSNPPVNYQLLFLIKNMQVNTDYTLIIRSVIGGIWNFPSQIESKLSKEKNKTD